MDSTEHKENSDTSSNAKNTIVNENTNDNNNSKYWNRVVYYVKPV